MSNFKTKKKGNIMRILHTSDWHIGKSDGEQSLLKDQRYFIDSICAIAEEENIDAVIIAGDVYDRQIASSEAVNLYDYAMTKLCKGLRKKVMIVAGNHDSAERLSTCSDLLRSAGLYISGSLKRDPDRVSFDGVDLYLLPWFTTEKAKSVFPEQSDTIDSYEDAYKAVLNTIKSTFDTSKKHILVSHAFITDSETSTSDRAAEIGSATQVSASLFDGFDYVALGHIHKPQDVNSFIRYSGTPMPYSFGKEERQEKSVTVIDTDTLSREIISVPLLHKRTTISGTYEELLDAKCAEEVRTGYVRLEVTDSYIGLQTLSELKAVYPNMIEIQGKTYDSGDSTVTLTLEELRRIESEPIEVFKQFCKDEIGEESDEHKIELFRQAIKETEEEQA